MLFNEHVITAIIHECYNEFVIKQIFTEPFVRNCINPKYGPKKPKLLFSEKIIFLTKRLLISQRSAHTREIKKIILTVLSRFASLLTKNSKKKCKIRIIHQIKLK